MRCRFTVLGMMIGVALSTLLVARAAASDGGAAKKLVVTQADVGSGYRTFKATPPPDPLTLGPIAECLHRPISSPATSAVVYGPSMMNFKKNIGIDSTAIIVRTEAMAEADRTAAADPGYPICFAQAFRTRLNGNTGDTASVSTDPLPLRRTYGSSTVAFGVSQGPSTNSPGPPASRAVILIFRGRAEVEVSFASVGDQLTIDQTTAEAILAKLNQRLLRARV